MQNNPVGSPVCSADLKYGNRIQVIESFLAGGVCSANDISTTIGLSRQTVMKSIQFFPSQRPCDFRRGRETPPTQAASGRSFYPLSG